MRIGPGYLAIKLLMPLVPATVPTTVGAQSPDTTEALRRTKAARYAGGGATMGAITFGLLGGIMNAGLCDQADCGGAFTKGFVGGAALGGLAGAVTGAIVGSMVHYWIPLQNDSSSVGLGLGVRVGVDAGLPSGVESLGYGSCAAPRPDTSLRGRIGHDLSPSTWAFAEAGRIEYRDNNCLGQGGSRAADLIDESASTTSVLLGAARQLDARGRLLVTGAVGVARTTLQRNDPSALLRGRDQTSTSEGVGLHFGTSVQAGWPLQRARSPRLGFELRADWITKSPMGHVPLTTFGVTVRR